jgi:hypothetical protein
MLLTSHKEEMTVIKRKLFSLHSGRYLGRIFLLGQLLNCHNSCNCETLTTDVILFECQLSLSGDAV